MHCTTYIGSENDDNDKKGRKKKYMQNIINACMYKYPIPQSWSKSWKISPKTRGGMIFEQARRRLEGNTLKFNINIGADGTIVCGMGVFKIYNEMPIVTSFIPKSQL